jgi:hypothetical protein
VGFGFAVRKVQQQQQQSADGSDEKQQQQQVVRNDGKEEEEEEEENNLVCVGPFGAFVAAAVPGSNLFPVLHTYTTTW